MISVDVYKTGTKIDSREIEGSFLILKHDDRQYSWGLDGEPNSSPGGAITIWFIADEYKPRFQLITPRWQLIVDGEIIFSGQQKEVNFFGIPLKCRTVELKHNDLLFVFHLPGIPPHAQRKKNI